MMSLPGWIFCLSLLRTCLATPIDTETAADSAFHFRNDFKCQGVCKKEHLCSAILNQTRCDRGLVCCIDHLEKATTTKKLNGDVLSKVHSSTIVVESSSEENNLFVYNRTHGNIPSSEGSKFIFNRTTSKSQDIVKHCPGLCVPNDLSYLCYKILPSEYACDPGATCCLTPSKNDYYEIGLSSSSPVKRSVPSQSRMACSGICVHPSHVHSCDEILTHLSCPLNARCCIQRSTEKVFQTSKPAECKGQCLPLKMQGYCFPPNELILGFTTCSRGTTCCMQRPAGSHIQPPSVNGMQFPHIPNRVSSSDSSQVVLGHLAVDEAGTVFKVGTNGQIFPLPRLTQMDHTRTKFSRLTAYPRFDGNIVIFSDPKGGLYQQFFPRQPPLATHVSESPLKRKPIKQFTKDLNDKDLKDKVPTAVTIPDDNSDSPVSEVSTPAIFDDKTSRPSCPGSCMSYFLRFTCFRGYAIYDGFTCPGKLVCCARLKDIEDHEEHLKSLSPYFSEPPRGKTFHRCGLKGRRDAPRIIGGKESLPGEWCWQVAIINVQNQYICGGALIDNSWVLTAAHCVSEPVKDNQPLFVRAGVTDLKSLEDNEKGQTIRVLSSFIHHNFNSINLDNNIALLRLQKPFDFNDSICVICLPTSGQMPQGSKKCTVTGYGFVSKDGDMSLKIREAQVPIIEDAECTNNVTEALTNSFIIPSNSFCAGGQGQQDACQGDAGGPLACDISGYHELVGLVSWGLGCSRSDVPSIYIKVPAFMGWINQIISSSSFLMSLP